MLGRLKNFVSKRKKASNALHSCFFLYVIIPPRNSGKLISPKNASSQNSLKLFPPPPRIIIPQFSILPAPPSSRDLFNLRPLPHSTTPQEGREALKGTVTPLAKKDKRNEWGGANGKKGGGGGRVLCNEVNEAAGIHRGVTRAVFRSFEAAYKALISRRRHGKRHGPDEQQHGQGFTKFLPRYLNYLPPHATSIFNYGATLVLSHRGNRFPFLLHSVLISTASSMEPTTLRWICEIAPNLRRKVVEQRAKF